MSIDKLKQVLFYDTETGNFTWTDKASYKCFVGKKAGSFSSGYVAIRYKRKLYKAHRLAWAFVYGTMPDCAIDHIDGNKSNNQIANLRLATDGINSQNIKSAFITNKSGYLGVSPAEKKWKATIRVSGKYKYLGVFETPELAHAAYVNAKRQFHKGCTI
jgi:hypothetical protein